jgi:hypothetical protein
MIEIWLQLSYAQVFKVIWFCGVGAQYYLNPSYYAAISSILQIQFITRESATTYETTARLHHKQQVMLTRVTSKFKVGDTKFQK